MPEELSAIEEELLKLKHEIEGCIEKRDILSSDLNKFIEITNNISHADDSQEISQKTKDEFIAAADKFETVFHEEGTIGNLIARTMSGISIALREQDH